MCGGTQIPGPLSVPGTGYGMAKKTDCSCPHGAYSLMEKNINQIIEHITNVITSWDKRSEGYKWYSGRE